jgi:uncharacterized protein YcbX
MQISALYIYPIKGCRGIAVSSAAVHDIGLEHDRRFMVVDENNRFVSQREHPAMARIAVTQTATGWALNRVDLPTLRWDPTPYGAESHVQIWKDTVAVVDQGADVAAWFSNAIGIPCRLVGFAPGVRRLVDQTFAVSADDAVSFADGYASLLVTEASLADLNTRTKEPVPMDRFRPNIVVIGSGAWEEDGWRTITVGGVDMVAVKKCARCLVTTTDQQSGERYVEPLPTLAEYRHIGHGLIFGQNMIHVGRGVIRIGDAITLS